jgi:ATP-dependent Clp protease ATP-binding subunit ClpC
VNLGFSRSDDVAGSYDKMKAKVSEELKQHFRPEFLNRVDEIIVFKPLSEAQLSEIVRLLLAGVERRLAEADITLKVTDAARALVARQGYDPVYGARPLRRAIQRSIENPLARRILAGEFPPGSTVEVDATPDGALTFNGSVEPASPPRVMSAPGGSTTVN